VIGDEHHRVIISLRESRGLPVKLFLLRQSLAVKPKTAGCALLRFSAIVRVGDEPGELAAGDRGPCQIIVMGYVNANLAPS
jgi:hypothetical protein